MLQRLQSLFLALTAIALAVFLATDLWVGSNATQQVSLNPYQITVSTGGVPTTQISIFYVAVIAVLGIGLSLFTIFQYKNRMRQMMLVALNSLLIAAAIATAVYHIKYDAMNITDGDFTYGMYAGFAALLFNWLANRFIRKDEKLVRSADRMR